MNNRIFKFRLWNIEDKSWDNPALLEVWDNSGVLKHLYDHNDEKSVVQQFTGLLDKNGKEIYEGDIIKRTMEVGPHCSYPDFKLSDAQKVGFGEVKWGSYSDGEYADAIDCYMFDNDSLSELIYRTKRAYQQYIRTYEVVGNIFENADLLN